VRRRARIFAKPALAGNLTQTSFSKISLPTKRLYGRRACWLAYSASPQL